MPSPNKMVNIELGAVEAPQRAAIIAVLSGIIVFLATHPGVVGQPCPAQANFTQQYAPVTTMTTMQSASKIGSGAQATSTHSGTGLERINNDLGWCGRPGQPCHPTKALAEAGETKRSNIRFGAQATSTHSGIVLERTNNDLGWCGRPGQPCHPTKALAEAGETKRSNIRSGAQATSTHSGIVLERTNNDIGWCGRPGQPCHPTKALAEAGETKRSNIRFGAQATSTHSGIVLERWCGRPGQPCLNGLEPTNKAQN